VASGLSLRLEVGASQVGTQLTIAHETVQRYEVIDWGSIVPLQPAVAVPTTAQQHFVGFGEKCNPLDQAGKLVGRADFRRSRALEHSNV
jgi:hypothetical protein